MKKKDICVVFVCDMAYFDKFIHTCAQLITKGAYDGTICLVIGDDLHHSELLHCDFIKKNHIIIRHFPNIQFSQEFLHINNQIHTDGRHVTKKFQWHKLHLFKPFFKQWSYVFYMDCGMTIFSDISPILNEATENALLAHSDAYPTYEWKLHTQFDTHNTDLFTKLNGKYNLNVDYFQTTIMLYDTAIITTDTYDDLLRLTYDFPISRTNEQGIIALYFTNVHLLFKQIKTHNEQLFFYDYLSRNNGNKYIMLKSV